MITQSKLKEILHYDPSTGIFTALVNRGTRCRVGDILGYNHIRGYISIMIDKKGYLSHRLAWLYVYGELPKTQIDHIDHDRKNNKINNLRSASNKENQRNKSKGKNNTSGFVGVFWHKECKKWGAHVRIDGKTKHLGVFQDKKDAVLARKLASAKYGFHKNHGL